MPAKLARGPLEKLRRKISPAMAASDYGFDRGGSKRAGAGQAGNTDFPFHFCIVRFQIRVSDRPIMRPVPATGPFLARFDEIDFVKTPEIGR